MKFNFLFSVTLTVLSLLSCSKESIQEDELAFEEALEDKKFLINSDGSIVEYVDREMVNLIKDHFSHDENEYIDILLKYYDDDGNLINLSSDQTINLSLNSSISKNLTPFNSCEFGELVYFSERKKDSYLGSFWHNHGRDDDTSETWHGIPQDYNAGSLKVGSFILGNPGQRQPLNNFQLNLTGFNRNEEILIDGQGYQSSSPESIHYQNSAILGDETDTTDILSIKIEAPQLNDCVKSFGYNTKALIRYRVHTFPKTKKNLGRWSPWVNGGEIAYNFDPLTLKNAPIDGVEVIVVFFNYYRKD